MRQRLGRLEGSPNVLAVDANAVQGCERALLFRPSLPPVQCPRLAVIPEAHRDRTQLDEYRRTTRAEGVIVRRDLHHAEGRTPYPPLCQVEVARRHGADYSDSGGRQRCQTADRRLAKTAMSNASACATMGAHSWHERPQCPIDSIMVRRHASSRERPRCKNAMPRETVCSHRSATQHEPANRLVRTATSEHHM